MKRVALFFFLVMIWPAICLADLTGRWSCDDGGDYYLRQVGNTVYWYGEPQAGNWSNVFYGMIEGNQIRGSWADVPKGGMMGRGNLTLTISPNEDEFVATYKSGGFGGSRWMR